MSNSSTTSTIDLTGGFPASTDDQWRALVDKVLKGADFQKRLVRPTLDGLKLEPLYRSAPDGLSDVVAPQGAGAWDVRCRVIATTGAVANDIALRELAGGATSIAVQIAAPGQMGIPISELSVALRDVDLAGAGVALDAGREAPLAAAALRALWTSQKLDPKSVFGAFGYDPLGTAARLGGTQDGLDHDLRLGGQLIAQSMDLPFVAALRANGAVYHRAGASEAQELAAIIATVVAYLRAAEAQGVAPRAAWAKIDVLVAVDADQLLGLAKMRALRRLLFEIAQAVGAADVAGQMVVAAETAERMYTARDAFTNILRSTLAVATAAMGGAQVITALPHTFALGQPSAFDCRIARNIHHVLAEESGLGRVADPAAGSFAVETLSQDLAQAAWDVFQEIEQAGGLAVALERGALQARILETVAKRARDVATGRIALTGSSAFPRLGDDGISVVPWPEVTHLEGGRSRFEGLPLRRLSEPFDQLRDQADELARQGRAPKIFFATLGALASHVARATWTRSFLAAGGIATDEPGPLLTSVDVGRRFTESGARVAVLVGDDSTYAELGEAAASLLKTAGAQHVWMAGRPTGQDGTLLAAGVDGFITAGCDMVDVLSTLQGQLSAST